MCLMEGTPLEIHLTDLGEVGGHADDGLSRGAELRVAVVGTARGPTHKLDRLDHACKKGHDTSGSL
jgi:hypothetical protein